MNAPPITHAVVTFGTHKSLECLLAVKPYNENYCKHFGMDFYHIDIPIKELYPKYVNTLRREVTTLKFSVLLYFMDNVKQHYDYIWWCDADIIFFNSFGINTLVNRGSERLFPIYNIFINGLNFRVHGGLYALQTTSKNISLLERGAFDINYTNYYFRYWCDNATNTLDECMLSEFSHLYKEGTQFLHVSNIMGQIDVDVKDIPVGAPIAHLDGKNYVFNTHDIPDYKAGLCTCIHVFGKNKLKNINRCIEDLDANGHFNYSTNL